MATSPDLGIPYIATQQNQPEITHNEALNMIAAVLKGAISIGDNAPPVSPEDGDVHIVGTSPSGAWAGRDNSIALWASTAWAFVPGLDNDGSPIEMDSRLAGLTIWVQEEEAQYRWSGTAWAVVTSGGGGAGLIEEVVTSGSQSTVTFSGIPGTFRNLRLLFTARAAGTAGGTFDTALRLQFNGDTAANYDTQQQFTAGSGGANVRNMGQTSFQGPQIATNNDNADLFDSGVVNIADYASATRSKSIWGQCSNTDLGSPSSVLRMLNYSGRWHNNAAIISITITLAAGNFADGSVLTLIGE